jgi:hypothetical protein
MTTGTVSLPEVPKGIDFEDFIAAYFQSDGQYVEKNLIKRDIDTILELDLIATKYYSNSDEKAKLIEIKSGSFGYEDVFKVRGWMDYLRVQNGLMVAKESSKKCNTEKLIEFAKILDIDLVIIPELSQSAEVLAPFIDPKRMNHFDISTWRYAYLTERRMIECLRDHRKHESNMLCYKAMKEYYSDVNNDIFFVRNVLDRINMLYYRYKTHPHLSAKCGNELIGNSFEDECAQIPKDVYKQTYDKYEFNAIQISTYIEHRSRLAILKNAVDFSIFEKLGINDRIENHPTISIEVFGKKYEFNIADELPKKFWLALDELKTEEFFYRYPVFWQWFMWIFGGFILLDYFDQEFDLLSQKTGIPVENIPDALNAYEKIFPTSGSWFFTTKTSQIKQLKNFPVPFKGVGVNFRRYYYSDNQDLDDLKLTGVFTKNDLIKWNNSVVNVLEYCKTET